MFRKTIISAMVISSVALPFASSQTVFAWHPKGVIIKSVQNITAQGELSDANTAASAVTAKPGDILRYSIIVKNDGAADSRGYNDMANTGMTDSLPDGVQLVSDTSKHTIIEDLGTIKPGQSVTKTYDVKVTSNVDKVVIENKACFTGNSTANDNPQSGCDVANVVIKVPEVIPTPTPPVTPPTPPVEQPTSLPNTGVGSNILLIAIATSVFGYIVSRIYYRKNS